MADKAFALGGVFARLMSRRGSTAIVFNELRTAYTWLAINPDEAVTVVGELLQRLPSLNSTSTGNGFIFEGKEAA